MTTLLACVWTAAFVLLAPGLVFAACASTPCNLAAARGLRRRGGAR